METHDWESDEAEHHVEEDNRSTKMVLVSEPAGGVHDNSGECVRGSNQTLSCADIEAHVSCQNDGKEVSKSVGNGRGVEKDLSYDQYKVAVV